ncbi:hypothetical protein LBJG_01364 [Lactobacillus jensenii 1153]|nr:hypothetical protein LBJG_01364 [Lactobacillus jensenii 1153]EEX27406.1 hypothetical protein HMPREF0527_01038 [Lactobacillus jensenii SJ-7A-US]
MDSISLSTRIIEVAKISKLVVISWEIVKATESGVNVYHNWWCATDVRNII